ncbi:MAG: hypothetical protein WBF53_16590 [Litorimonas sp.]
MPDLNPAPATLGLASPILGPWFSSSQANAAPLELGLTDGRLCVPLTLPDGTRWLAPAGCTRTVIVASAQRPPLLAGLRDVSGGAAFTDGSLVVLVTLLPEVEARLWSLSAVVPSPELATLPLAEAATQPDAPKRPRIRSFALELTSTPRSIDELGRWLDEDFSTGFSEPGSKEAYLGLLSLSANAANGGASPVMQLRRPVRTGPKTVMQATGAPINGRFWSFDAQGRPIDPGAVACWWSWMCRKASGFPKLWVDPSATDPDVCTVAEARTVHFVNAHRGPLPPEQVGRLDLAGLDPVDGSAVLFRTGPSGGGTPVLPSVALKAATGTDLLPIARIAALPNGTYAKPGSTAEDAKPFEGWKARTDPGSRLRRDFLRIAVDDVETLLTGLNRNDARQADAGTRLGVARNTAQTPFLPGIDDVNRTIMEMLAAGDTVLMAPVMDALWGECPPATIADVGIDKDPADPVHELKATAYPLAGVGQQQGKTASGQSVAMELDASSLSPGSWVRIWTHGLDTKTGLRFRNHGGACLVAADGRAFLVTPLPDGLAGGEAKVSFDALIVTRSESRLLFDQSCDRPEAVAGDRLDLSDTSATVPTLWDCEAGTEFMRGAATYRSAHTLLALSSDPTTEPHRLVDLSSLPADDLHAHTLLKAVASGDTLIRTTPAFAKTPEGGLAMDSDSQPERLDSETALHRSRARAAHPLQLGYPILSQERRELCAVRTDGSRGVVGAHPGRKALHESPPMMLGHPGVPATSEAHASGIVLEGPSAALLAERMRERRLGLIDYIDKAGEAPPSPTAPSGSGTWTTVLETMASGMAGGPVLQTVPPVPLNRSWTELKTAIEAAIKSVTGAVGAEQTIDLADYSRVAEAQRAVARVDALLDKTHNGRREFATSLQAAINRAEDFIYLQTPAIDDLKGGPGEVVDLVGTLKTRLSERPALRLVIALSENLEAASHEDPILKRVRLGAARKAMEALSEAAPGRVAAFHPIAGPGRPGRIVSTMVVVDDVLMLTGSTHLWRRGLTFDSSLAVALFDEQLRHGRGKTVETARRNATARLLGLPDALLPLFGDDLVDALNDLRSAGGLVRSDADLLTALPKAPSEGEMKVWNPDGAEPGGNWFNLVSQLVGDAAKDKLDLASR